MPVFNGQQMAKDLVFDYASEHLDKTDDIQKFTEDDVYVVWWSKTLQNWKAMVSTTLLDGMYYEVTYNGDKEEVYLDAYKKFDNRFASLANLEETPDASRAEV